MKIQMYQYPVIQSPNQTIHYQQARSITQPTKTVHTKIITPPQPQSHNMTKTLNSVYINNQNSTLNQMNINNSLTGVSANISNFQNQQPVQQHIQEKLLTQQSPSVSMMHESQNQMPQQMKQQLGNMKIIQNMENNGPSYPQPKILKSSMKANWLQQSQSNKDFQNSILNTSKQTYSRKSEQGVVVKHLTDKIAVLIEEINKLTATVDELLGDNEKWKNKYRRVKQLYVNKISQVSNAKEKLKKQCEQNDPQVEELKQVIKSYQQEIGEIKKKYEEFKMKEGSKYNDDQQKLIETIEIYQEDALNWKEKYEALAESSQKQNKMIEKLQNELEKTKQGNKTKPLKNNQEEVIALYEQKLQEDQEQINELQENLQEYESQLNQITEENQNLQSELQEKDELIKQGSKAYEEKINQLQQEIEELQQKEGQEQQQEQDQELVEQNQMLEEKLNEIGQDNETLQEENQQLQQINKKLEAHIIELQSQQDKVQSSKDLPQTSLTSPQSKPQKSNDGSDDYLVRQLRKFQELQAQKGVESVQSKKGGKMQKGASNAKGSFGGKKSTKR